MLDSNFEIYSCKWKYNVVLILKFMNFWKGYVMIWYFFGLFRKMCIYWENLVRIWGVFFLEYF